MRKAILFCGLAALVGGTSLSAQDKAPRPVLTEDGVVHVPAFDLPPSELSSAEARAAQAARAKMPSRSPKPDADIAAVRQSMEAAHAGDVERMKQLYPVDIAEQAIGGVRTRIITPKGKPFDKDRVLINLHGGAFIMCAEVCAMIESIPIAALGGYKVVTVDYRMSPEARHPAALEDVEKVYRELLKSYQPKHIGIYGCSAGGALTAETAAWLPARGLPQAGAVGIFGAGGVRLVPGDSAWVAAYIDGSFRPPPAPGQSPPDLTRGYFDGVDKADPIVSAALHPEVLAKFPPTLLITGTRAADMSPAVFTNSKLLKAGVRSSLIVEEGMGHCYIYQPDLPEAKDGLREIVKFFKENLK